MKKKIVSLVVLAALIVVSAAVAYSTGKLPTKCPAGVSASASFFEYGKGAYDFVVYRRNSSVSWSGVEDGNVCNNPAGCDPGPFWAYGYPGERIMYVKLIGPHSIHVNYYGCYMNKDAG